ncbi:MAG: DNA gyrase subunit A, partial [Anaerolineae bacterium]
IAALDVITPEQADADLLIVTERGYGKRTQVDEFRQQGRYGQGVRAISNDLSKTGRIVGAGVVEDENSYDLTVITRNGIALRTPVNEISTYGRTAQGVKIIHIDPDDMVVSIALVDSGVPSPATAEQSHSSNGYVAPNEDESGEIEAPSDNDF